MRVVCLGTWLMVNDTSAAQVANMGRGPCHFLMRLD
jgi:hypothetical protein